MDIFRNPARWSQAGRDCGVVDMVVGSMGFRSARADEKECSVR